MWLLLLMLRWSWLQLRLALKRLPVARVVVAAGTGAMNVRLWLSLPPQLLLLLPQLVSLPVQLLLLLLLEQPMRLPSRKIAFPGLTASLRSAAISIDAVAIHVDEMPTGVYPPDSAITECILRAVIRRCWSSWS